MQPCKSRHLEQGRRSNRFDMRWALSIVFSVMILLGQSFPAMASSGATMSANWVEICGDGGSYFVQIGEDDQKQAPECAHCDYCLTHAGDTQAVHSTGSSGSALKYSANISYLADPATLPDCPEQYWSACRGPPIASVEIK